MKLTIGIRLFLASAILFVVVPHNAFAAMIMAAIVLKFPSWNYYKGRLCDGAQTPELEAITKVSKQVDEFKTQLGDRVLMKDFNDAKKALDDLTKNIGKYSEKEIDAALDTINKANEKLHKQMEEMAEDVAKAKEKGSQGPGKLVLFDPADVAKFVSDTFQDGHKTNNKATIKINGGIVLKAAETFGYPQFFEGAAGTDITAFTGRFIDPTLYQRKRKRNFILDNMAIETIGVPTLIYLEKIEVAGANESQEDVGGADWIVSGAEKPKRSFRVTSSKVEAKKIAIFGTVED
jgi:gas vesicle protein